MPHRSRSFLRTLAARALAVLAVLLLLQPLHAASAVCVASQLSFVSEELQGHGATDEDDCCPQRDAEETPSPDEPHESCPCPFPCASGCSGQPRGVVPATLLLSRVPLAVLAVFTPRSQSAPPDPEPLGILHVPKLGTAGTVVALG